MKTGILAKEEEQDQLDPPRLTLHASISCQLSLIGHLDLENVKATGDANFRLATFRSRAGFRGVTFSDEADFSSATFHRWADFRDVTFSACANFLGATFNDAADLRNASFSREAQFFRATFSGRADLDGCTFLSCSLSEARFEKFCSLAGIAAGEIDLSEAVFTEGVRLSPDSEKFAQLLNQIGPLFAEGSELIALKEEEFQLLHEWQEAGRAICRVDFRGSLIQGDLRCDFEHISPVRKGGPRHDPVLSAHAYGNWREAEKQYAWLKEQYRKQGAYGDEDEAHWWASECARRRTLPAGNRFWLMIPLLLFAFTCYGILGPEAYLDALPLFLVAWAGASLLCLPRWGKWLIFRKAFGYGVRPWNIVITILVVVLAFGCLFWRAEAAGLIRSTDPPAFTSPLLKGLYFSAITFATVGYGDVRALGWAASAAMIEGFLGILLNAALVVVIFRKMIR